jgi:hypothetical protein
MVGGCGLATFSSQWLFLVTAVQTRAVLGKDYSPYLKAESLREPRVPCQETLTKNAFNTQTTLYISGNMHAQKRHPAAYSRLPYNIKHSHGFACQS